MGKSPFMAGPQRVPVVLASLMVLLILSVMVSVFVPILRPVGGVLLLLVAVAGFSGLRREQKISIILLSGAGVALAVAGIVRGSSPTVEGLLAVNQEIVAMILAVSFVAIVAKPEEGPSPRWSGIPAVFRTAAISHLLGSVINLSAVTLVGDRLARGGQLSIPNALLLSRTYSLGAFWSPFWAAAAAALTFAPQANPTVLILAGLVMSTLALTLGTIGVVKRLGTEVESYEGYGLSPTVIVLPLLLVVSVMTAHWLWPEVKTTNLVLMASLALTILLLLWRSPRQLPRILFEHSRLVLPRMRSESSLFASAGVLAVGFSIFLRTTNVQLPDVDFGVVLAWLAMLLVIVLSVFGVHQIITIGVLATILAPLNPDPTLFAMACTVAWGTCAAVSPIGGLNLFIMGRYGISNATLSRENLLFALGIVVLAIPLLAFVASLNGTGWW